MLKPDVEKVEVEIDLTPDYTVTAILPKSQRTLADFSKKDDLPDLPDLKISDAERRDRLGKLLDRMRKGL